MNTLVCGPYVGEFGWEIFSWSGYCRALSRHFEKTTVITRPGHGFLYCDFASVQCFTPPADGISDCENNTAMSHDDLLNVVRPFLSSTTFWLPPFKNESGAYQHWSQPLYIPAIKGALPPEYLPCPNAKSSKRDKVLLHARDRGHIRVNDNAPLSLFVELTNCLKSRGMDVVSIGASESSHVEGTIDMRNISLDDLSLLMDSAICTLGPSSGPLHFAALVNCPVITWSSSAQNAYRYLSSWNPLDTKLVYIDTTEDELHAHPDAKMLVWTIDRIQHKNFRKLQIDNV